MESLLRDLRFGVRMLLGNRLGTGLALLTLALGIGANTAIFSVVSGVLLQPLPVPQPERLVSVIASAPRLGFPRFNCSAPDFKDWREQNQIFAGLAAMQWRRFTLASGGAPPQSLLGARVSGDFFGTFEVRPVVGRLLGPADDRPGGERLAVLSYDLWRQRFGADPGVVNRRVAIDGHLHTVIGVAPRELDFLRSAQLWLPLALDYAKEGRGSRGLRVVGRLRPGVSLERAQADMSAVAGRLARQYPETNTAWGVLLMRLHDQLVEGIRPALTLLQWAVWLVMLIACANVANLLLARMAAREREIAVRAALGAGRARLIRQVVAETVILFAAGGGLGLLLAFWGTRALIALEPEAIPRAARLGIDARVLVYTLFVAVATGAVFGLVPALSAVGRRLFGALKEGGRAVAGGGRGRRVRDLLVLAEVALALILLVCAGLLLQSFARLRSVDPGFQPRGVLTAVLAVPEGKYPDDPRQVALYRRLLARFRALPGVEHAAAVFPLPLGGSDLVFECALEGRPTPKKGEEQHVAMRMVSPDYFRALGIPLLRGRAFAEQDDLASPRVAIVNRAMAAKNWPGEDPVGRRVTFGDDPADPRAKWWTVVGVVGDVRADKLALEPETEAYRSLLQSPYPSLTLVARTAVAPLALAEPMRRAVQEVGGDLALDRVQTLEQVVSASLAQGRVKTFLLAIFAALALVLAAVGVYGLVSYSVTQRLHEIGVRIALGARRGAVLGLVLGQGMRLVAAGLAVGLACSWAAARLLAGQLYMVSVNDPWTYLAVPAVLAAVALVANWLPAQKATRVDPLTALRRQ
ncbi:MAG TPA: ABC transporter permease [Thermoanaerobaculia bacterium]|nr:ABC transporter permease [Thermoanaerobaculia bacterium]